MLRCAQHDRAVPLNSSPNPGLFAAEVNAYYRQFTGPRLQTQQTLQVPQVPQTLQTLQPRLLTQSRPLPSANRIPLVFHSMPAYNRRIAIVGAAESDYGRVPHMTEMQLHAQAFQRVLEDSGLRKEDIDSVFCSSHTLGMPMVMLCEYLQLFPRYSDTTSIGGSSFEAHLNHAVAAIRAGKCDVALITYASN